MNRYLLGLVAATGLSLGMTSDAKAQVALAIGNPYAGSGMFLNTGVAPVGYYNAFYGRPGVRRHVPRGYGYGYAPRAYVAPRYYGGYAPRVHNRGHHRGHRGHR